MKIAVDVETTGLLWHKHAPFAIGIWADDQQHYIDCAVTKKKVVNWEKPYQTSKEVDCVRKLIETADELYFHNAKFDLHMLRNIGLVPKGKIHDTMLMSRIYNNREKNFKLKPLAQKYLNITNTDEEDLKAATRIARKQTNLQQFNYQELYWLPKYCAPTNTLCEKYCLKDVERTYKLAQFYLAKLVEFGLQETYEFERKLVPILLQMERTGVRFFNVKAKEKLFHIQEQLLQVQTNLETHYPGVNFNSSQQVAKLLLTLGVPLTERTEPSQTFPNGQLKANSKIFSDFEANFSICKLLVHRNKLARSLNELLNYLAVCSDDNIHPSINQCNAVTWRFSMSDPNLQKTTTRLSKGNEFVAMRDLFGPRDGYLWLAADYEQIELRIFADSSQEPYLLNAFRQGKDVHDETTDRIPFLVAMAQKEGRAIARHYGKSTNFTIVNGGGKNALWNNYRIPKEQGAKCIAGFKQAYPEAEKYMRNQIAFAKTHGFIQTKTKRVLRTDPERPYTTAINYDIQPCAGDIMKAGLVNCYNWIQTHATWDDIRILLSIHDELIFEIRETFFDLTLAKTLKALMEQPSEIFSIPIPVHCELITENWQTKKDLPL